MYDTCPYSTGQIDFASPWFSANTSTPDYFNICNSGIFNVPNNFLGYQQSNSGQAYSGITFYNTGAGSPREYIEVQLIDTLKTNSIYCVSFYVSLANISKYATSNLSVYFSNSILNSGSMNYINVIPQIQHDSNSVILDTTNWTFVSANFVASGGERYLTIGNFRPNSTSIIDSISGSFQPDAYYFIDDVSVIDCDSLVGVHEYSNNANFTLYPNPNNGTMEISYFLNSNENGVFEVYDVTGKRLMNYVLDKSSTILKIENKELAAGVYYYNIRINEKTIKADKLVIIK